jgi:hypothetical protein
MLHKIRVAMSERNDGLAFDDNPVVTRSLISLFEEKTDTSRKAMKRRWRSRKKPVYMVHELMSNNKGSAWIKSARFITSRNRSKVENRVAFTETRYIKLVQPACKYVPLPRDYRIGAKAWPGIMTGNLNRVLSGIYHGVSSKYAQLYFDEFCFRFNNRGVDGIFEDVLASLLFSVCKKADNHLDG